MKKVHMLYKEDKDNKEIIEAFTTNEYIAELFVEFHRDKILGIDTWDMYDEDYEKFIKENYGKEIIKFKPNSASIGLFLVRRCDKPIYTETYIGSLYDFKYIE